MLYILKVKVDRGYKGSDWCNHGIYLNQEEAIEIGKDIKNDDAQILDWKTISAKPKGELKGGIN